MIPKRKYLRYKTVLAFFSLLFISCHETELKIDLPAPKPKLVVYSTFTPFTPPKVKSFSVSVSQNGEVFDTLKIDQISDAKVSLYIDGLFCQIMKFDKKYGYRADFFPKAGVEYSISVEKQGFETVTAKGTIPEKVPIKSCELIPFAGMGEDGWAFSQLSVTIDDPADQINYYEIMVLGYQDENDKYMLTTNDKVITSESYYPSPILMDANRPRRLLFSDKQINGQTHKVEMTFDSHQSLIRGKLYITPHLIFLSFRSVSEAYYRYYTTVFKQANSRRGDLLFGIAEPSPVYTNIQNGYGVFAGYYEDNRSFLVDTIRVR
jgi:hypothetical protein